MAGTIAAGDIIGRAQRRLVARTVLWTDEELLEYLSDAQRRAVQIRPEVNPVTRPFQLVAGTRQTLEPDAFLLIDVIRNLPRALDAAAMPPVVVAIAGKAIKPIVKTSIERGAPLFHTQDPDETEEVLYDRRNRGTFFVVPPAPPNPHRIEIVVAKIPAELAAMSTIIELDDVYEPILLNYTLAEAYSKGVGILDDAQGKSDMYMRRFEEALRERESSDVRLQIVTGLDESAKDPG